MPLSEFPGDCRGGRARGLILGCGGGHPHPRDEDLIEGRDASVDAMRFPDVFERRAQHDLPPVDHRHVIGDLLHLFQQVRRKQDSAAFMGDGADDGAEYVAANDGIEAG